MREKEKERDGGGGKGAIYTEHKPAHIHFMPINSFMTHDITIR